MKNEKQIDQDVLTMGQPTPEDIAELKKRGVREIINLRAPEEDGYWDGEKVAAEAAGIDYTNIPITPSTIDDSAVARVHQAIESAGGPVVIHCKSGGRAGVMTLLHLAVKHGWGVQQALDEGQQRGLECKPDSPYRAFFEQYLHNHSPAER